MPRGGARPNSGRKPKVVPVLEEGAATLEWSDAESRALAAELGASLHASAEEPAVDTAPAPEIKREPLYEILWVPPAYMGPNTAIEHVLDSIPLSDLRERVRSALYDDSAGYEGGVWARFPGLECVGDFVGMSAEELLTRVPTIDIEAAYWLLAHIEKIRERIAA